MIDLSAISWKDLNCAYGSSERVCELLHLLRSGPFDQNAIDDLYGCICHQGTIYEVTPYVIRFLHELVMDHSFSARVDVLFLLGAVARATSKNAMYVTQSRTALLSHADDLVSLSKDPELRLASAYVLCTLNDYASLTVPLLRDLITSEDRPNHKAGLLLLLGETGDSSGGTRDLVMRCLSGRKNPARHAAAVTFARLRLLPVTALVKKCIISAISDNYECELLPWGSGGQFGDSSVADNLLALKSCLSTDDIDTLVNNLCHEVEKTGGGYSSLSLLLDLILERKSQTLTFAEITYYHKSVLLRVFSLIEPSSYDNLFDFTPWGLPRSRRARRSLLSGTTVGVPDASLPLLSLAESPRLPIAFASLRSGMRIHHRSLGAGDVLEVESSHGVTMAKIEFDLEGKLTISDRAIK